MYMVPRKGKCSAGVLLLQGAMLAGVGVCALPNANRRHAHRLEPPGRKGSPSSLPSENRKQKLVFDQAACTSILEGTRLINGTLERIDGDVGETSDREVIFNLGSYKTGSTSLNEALGLLGYRANVILRKSELGS